MPTFDDAPDTNTAALTAASCLGPLLVELLGALHDEGVLTPAQTARVLARWSDALRSWEKRPGMRTTVLIMQQDLAAEAAHRLPSIAPASAAKPTRLSRVPRK